ncbi:MAG: hypothetical protein ABI112_01570 [Terracoccus sp.]
MTEARMLYAAKGYGPAEPSVAGLIDGVQYLARDICLRRKGERGCRHPHRPPAEHDRQNHDRKIDGVSRSDQYASDHRTT